ncbi:LuxR C-terminal-related transcriptional regulator [Chloroflexota bacterium]
MPNTLLATKLHIPRLRRDLVHRPRLMERLDAGLQGKLTLVSAPAGYGKTTLVADWIDVSQAPAAWLSLDEADNDPARFLTYVIAAFQRIDENIGVDVQAALAESQSPPGETLLTRLVNDIAAARDKEGQKTVLVLDDYHLITAQTVHKALNFLLGHLPETVHMLVSGRSDPPLPISRLRVQGEITEIRTPELRFTEGEAVAFLNDLMGLGLSSGDVAALEARTEGWIASLQLAALSLQGRPDKRQFVAAFSGSHRYVIDYLVDEVLSRQPEDIQVFLRRTSTFDRFCAPLCDMATEIATSRQILRRLEHDNFFLVPLDEERRWYRYHHLFAGFLQQRLRQREPGYIPELHSRASQWYEGKGLVDEAIQHALKAGDVERAARLVDQIAASLVVRRQPNKLLGLVNQLPATLCHAYPMLCMWHAWALLFVGQLDAVEPVLQIAESQQGKVPQVPIPAYATTVRAYLANQMGDLPGALDLTQQAIEQLSEAPPDQTTLIFQGAAVIWLGVNYRHLGHLDRARRLFVEATSINQQAGNIYAALSTLEQLADLAVIQGQLHRAIELHQRGLQMSRKWSEREGLGRGTLLAAFGLHLGLGTVLYQRNDLAGAARHIQRAFVLGELEGSWWRMHSQRMLAYLRQAEGDHQAAYDLLGQACAIRDSLIVRQANVSTEPSLEQLRILLSQRQPSMAHLLRDSARRAESLDLGWEGNDGKTIDFTTAPLYAREADYADLARVLTATGRAAEGLPLIDLLLEASQVMGRQGDAIRYLVMQALAFHAQGDMDSALTSLNQALTQAQPEGYVRVFVDEGQPMVELLREAASRGFAPEYVTTLLAVFGEPAKGRMTKADRSSTVLRPSSSLVEPLSDRELEVLRLMAAGLKHREVAEELIISLNTVRHHARNIYGKLDVNSRAQAVAKAKELRLI